jgi:four helix bundle protein
MAPYRTLKAWQHAQRLAVECAKAAKTFPAYEQEALADQLRRAAYGVSLNIAEGSTRRGTREYRKFLDTAYSSLAEVEAALDIARQLDYVSQPDSERLAAIVTETGKTLFGLLRKITDATRPLAARPSSPLDV